MARPKVVVHIDFAQDGGFTQATDDVTTDVERVVISRGKNLLHRRPETGQLQLLMKNNSNKYSPSYTGSPLWPGNIPAPDVRVLMGYPVDDFIAANDTALSSRKPSHDALFAAWAGDTGEFVVDTNQIKCTAGDRQAVLEFSRSDCWVGVLGFTRTGTNSGLILRYADTSNFLLVRATSSRIYLDKIVAGSQTNVTSAAFTWTDADTKELFVLMQGTSIFVFVHRTLVISATGVTQGAANTKHGIGGTTVNTADRWNNFGGWRPRFTGRLDKVEPIEATRGEKRAFLHAFDDMERMSNHLVFRLAPDPPATYAQIVGEILDAVDFSATERRLSTGSTLSNQPLAPKAMGRDGLSELIQVQEDEVGFIYIDGAGVLVAEDEDFRLEPPRVSPIRSWYGDRQNNNDTDVVFSELNWDDGKERVQNEIYYKYHTIHLTSEKDVWRLGGLSQTTVLDKPAIGNSAPDNVVDFLAVGSGESIADPVTPSATTDYLVNSLANGTGTNLTGNVTASLVGGFDGNFILVRLTNTGDAGFVTLLKLRAKEGVAQVPQAARAEDSVSQTWVGRRRVEHNSLHVDEYGMALEKAKKMLKWRQRPKTRVEIVFLNGTRETLMEMVHVEISDKVDLQYDPMTIDGTFFVEGEQIIIEQGGTKVEVEYELEQAVGAPWAGTQTKWNQFQWG